ncbi:P-loop containing nucleoside triphosphate hydrolase protein [Elysia marginata]|uniref:P-loop containing nucleoside triphosphate hydrolase protein n=1 Tax=Elysia marginata TaxID=1093978 RepID=A0AAV4H1L3_9GAST|nr:P-loop containing nucleoside triphosphate hydrolase protein [Elysia marginata]
MSADRPEHSSQAKKPQIAVVVEGEIGAGKTTLIELVRKALETKGVKPFVVPEPVDEWMRVGILQAFYADNPPELQRLISYVFQTYTFLTRILKTRQAVSEHPDADIFLLERSVLTDRYVFMELQREQIGPNLMEMYTKWWKMWALLMPVRPRKAIYLKPSIENCQLRVAARARRGEIANTAAVCRGVSADYQARLRRAHEAFLQGLHTEEFPEMPPPPFAPEDVVVVDGTLADHNFSTPGLAADQTVAHVVEKILGV